MPHQTPEIIPSNFPSLVHSLFPSSPFPSPFPSPLYSLILSSTLSSALASQVPSSSPYCSEIFYHHGILWAFTGLVIGCGTHLSCLYHVLFRFFFFSPLNNFILPTIILPLVSHWSSRTVKFHLHGLHPSSDIQIICSVYHSKVLGLLRIISNNHSPFTTGRLSLKCFSFDSLASAKSTFFLPLEEGNYCVMVRSTFSR